MIKIKIVDRSSNETNNAWLKNHFPNNKLVWNNCEFCFDPFEKEYDWFVVRDDIPRSLPKKMEELNCARKNTILITSEPSSITFYGKGFAKQFGHLITSQSENDLPHPNAQRTQTGSTWFYGKSYDEIKKEAAPKKSKLISIVGSNKQQKHTMHKTRFDFTNSLVKKIPEVEVLFSYKELAKEFFDIFGEAAKLVDSKADMIDDYKYHIAIGNQVGPHILTERVTDAFLGYAVPISFGCTNMPDYFPEDSFVDIDVTDFESSISKIKEIISSEGDYGRRLGAVKEARRRVLDEYNIVSMIAEIVENAEPQDKIENNGKIYNRKFSRVRYPPDLFKYIWFRTFNFIKALP